MTSQEAITILEKLVAVFAGEAKDPPLLTEVKEAIEVVLAEIAVTGGKTLSTPELSESSGAFTIDRENVSLIEALLKWHHAVQKAAAEKAALEELLPAEPRYNAVRKVLKI